LFRDYGKKKIEVAREENMSGRGSEREKTRKSGGTGRVGVCCERKQRRERVAQREQIRF